MGLTGPQGNQGLGFTGGSYNASTGIVSFTSDDNLGFNTADLRGDGNRGISSATVDANDDLILTLVDNTTINAGAVVGPTGATGSTGATGPAGADGLGFTGGSYTASTGIVTFTSDDGLGFTTGDLRGDGNRGISSATVDANDDLILTLADSTTINAGAVVGPQGPTGPTGATGPTGPTGPAGADGADGADGTNGTNGVDGTGFTGGSYDLSTGTVTFTSDDGLGFTTGDLRGVDGVDGADGADGASSIVFDIEPSYTSGTPSAFSFSGAGFPVARTNPDLYLQKGITYYFDPGDFDSLAPITSSDGWGLASSNYITSADSVNGQSFPAQAHTDTQFEGNSQTTIQGVYVFTATGAGNYLRLYTKTYFFAS